MKTKKVTFFPSFFLIAILFLTILSSQIALGAGPGSSWPYFRPVDLSAATPAASYQVKVTLASGQYTHMKSDGSDIRFYDESNNLCVYWIETWNNTGNSTIWVKVPTAGTTTLAMYYGNASATAVSSGTSTFDFFDDFNGSSLAANWQQSTTSGTVSVSGGIATLSCNATSGSASAYISSPFTPATTSFVLEVKHQEGAYNRNRFYATTSNFAGSPLGFDYGYFSSQTTAQSTGQVFYNTFPGTTSLTSNTDYLTQWRITDGSTYNWNTYLYSTGAAISNGTKTGTLATNVRYIHMGVSEVSGTTEKIDWVRLRQNAVTEPTSTVGNEASTTGASPLSFTTSGSFVVPDGVTSLTVECWGAGGGGSTITSSGRRGGGGGGGAFASSVIAVSPGNIFPIVVGTGGAANTAGTNSTFNTSTVIAAGGNGGTSNATTAGTGGTTANSTGSTKYAGGDGATGGTTYSGGGGGGAGSTGAGGNAPTAASGSFGTGTSQNGGNGGASVSGSTNGNNGNTYGGGGSGACTNSSTARTGGSGANGQVIISWCTPPAAPSVTSPVRYCQNSTASPLTATGSSLLWYTVPTGGTGSSTAPTPSTATIGTTSYYVSQTVGCEGPRAQIDVIIYRPVSAVNNQTNVSCFGGNDGTITIQASGGVGAYQFSVSNGATYTTGSNPNPYTYPGLSANNQYKIRVKDSLGCESIAIP
ncbi:MAG: DUF2341 domain-containing protein [Bacteroidetes bacterium]|nr:DUF2341 domain-containing protein [Bacteroidota bacterium]